MKIWKMTRMAWLILGRYFIRRERKPFLSSYKITHQCNLRCRQCPFPYLDNYRASFSEVKATIDRLAERGNQIVIFEGGEPTLWQDPPYNIKDVISYARTKFTSVGLTTNGTNGVDIPVDTLWVSIDGLEQTHNDLRGKEIFNSIMDNIRQSQHPKLYAHITINKRNAAELPELIPYLSQFVKGITVQFFYPYTPDDDLYLDKQTKAEAIETLIRLINSGYPILNSKRGLRSVLNKNRKCLAYLVDNAYPDGSIQQGCYLAERSTPNCEGCGFTPYTELSLAFRGSIPAILAGLKIFF